MKSLRFHSRKIVVYLYLALFITAISCSEKDTDVTPANGDKKPPPITSISKTIGSDGGTIALDSISISIPNGAFSVDYKLDLAVETNPTGYPQPTVTSIYKLKGFPDQFSKPIRMSIKYSGILNEDSYIAWGHDEILPLEDTTVFSYDLIDCQDSTGYLAGYLVPPEDLNSGGRKTKLLTSDDIIETWNFFAGITSYRTKKTERFDYYLVYPTTLDPAVIDQFASNLEDIHEKFYNLGFQESNFPTFRLFRSIKILDYRGWEDDYPSHVKYPFGIDNNKHFKYYAFTSINIEKLRSEIGSAFFHRFKLYLYWEKLDYKKSWHSFDRSVEYWMEEKWNEFKYPDSFLPSYFSEEDFRIYFDIFHHDFTKYYYMTTNCEVIKYLATKYGEEFIVGYYKELIGGSEKYKALSNSVDDPANVWLPDFYKRFLKREIYRLSESLFADKVFNNSNTAFHKPLPSPNITNNHFEKYPDLSARVFYFNMDNPDLNENSILTFSISSKEVESKNLQGLLFSIDRNSKVISFLKNGTHLEIDDPLYYKNKNSDLFMIVVNSQTLHMNDNRESNLSTIQLEVSLNEAMPYHHLMIYLDSIIVIRKYNNGQIYTDPRAHNHFGELIVYDEYKGSFSKDNVFTGNWDYMYTPSPENRNHFQGDVKATLDPESLLLIDFDFRITSKHFDPSGEYDYMFEDKRRVTGSNVLLEKSYYGLYGRIKGEDIKDHINLFEFSIKYADPDNNNLHGFYAEDFQFNENSVLKIFFSDQN